MRFTVFAALVCAGLLAAFCKTAAADEVRYHGPRRILHRHPAQVAKSEYPTTADFPRAYPWGYFGAQPGRYKVYHRGYYGHYYEWGYTRSY